MRLERRQAPVSIRDEANAHTRRGQIPQGGGHIVEHLEVLAGGPFIVDLAGTVDDSLAAPSHLLDDVRCVVDEDLRVVELTRAFQKRGCTGDAPVEPVHRTRLWLNDATGQVLRNGLDLLGVSAPERM